MKEQKRQPAKLRNFSLAFEKMCNFVAIARTRNSDETLGELILQCFVLLPDDQIEGAVQLVEAIDILFGLQFSEYWVQSTLDRLVSDGKIQKSTGTNYIVRPEISKELKRQIDEAHALEQSVKHEWIAEIVFKFPTLSTEQAWTALQAYLTKAFRRHGLQAAALLDQSVDITPEHSESLTFLIKDALKETLPEEQWSLAKEAISIFLANVGEHPNRTKYIAQIGDGAFNYFSLTVAPDTAEKFQQNLKPMTLFLDTNFLFGILDLHTNPLVQVSNELLRAIKEFSLPFHLRYHKATEEEIQKTISYYRQQLRSCNWSQELSSAAINSHCVTGIVAKYHQMNAEKGIDVDTFFGLYKHADEILKEKDITKDQTTLPEREEFLELVSQYKRFLAKKNKEKPDKTIEHDMALLDTVRRLRTDVKSSLEAGALIITCDYALYQFDLQYRRQENKLMCVVLPNLFWQILRPFVPADLDFERSFAETFALPEFRTIGSGASEACSKMLCLLSLYKPMSEETAVRLLSNEVLIEGLRKVDDDAKFQEQVESAIVADNAVLIEERAAMARQLEIERNQRKAKGREIEEENIKLQADADRKKHALKEKEEELESLKKTISDEKRESKTTLSREKQAREEAEKRIAEEEKSRKKAERSSEIYSTCLSVILGLSLIGLFEYLIYEIPWNWLINHPKSYGLQGSIDTFILLIILGLFKSKWRKWLWRSGALFGLFFVILSLMGGPAGK